MHSVLQHHSHSPAVVPPEHEVGGLVGEHLAVGQGHLDFHRTDQKGSKGEWKHVTRSSPCPWAHDMPPLLSLVEPCLRTTPSTICLNSTVDSPSSRPAQAQPTARAGTEGCNPPPQSVVLFPRSFCSDRLRYSLQAPTIEPACQHLPPFPLLRTPRRNRRLPPVVVRQHMLMARRPQGRPARGRIASIPRLILRAVRNPRAVFGRGRRAGVHLPSRTTTRASLVANRQNREEAPLGSWRATNLRCSTNTHRSVVQRGWCGGLRNLQPHGVRVAAWQHGAHRRRWRQM